MVAEIRLQASAVKLTSLARKDLPSITASGGCYVVAEPARTTRRCSDKSLILMVSAMGFEPMTS
jgi:hypothetical protein